MAGKIKGQLIGGKFEDLLIRVKNQENVLLGELLVVESDLSLDIVQVFDIEYSSQISSQNLELASGLFLEKEEDVEFIDSDLRNYRLAHAKILFRVNKKSFNIPKSLPNFFSFVKELKEEDLEFFDFPQNSLLLGNIRSGDRILDLEVGIQIEKLLSEHILIAASTGKGKSNLTSCLLFDGLSKNCSFLVLDPHDEYYGRNGIGLKDHPLSKEKLYYFTSQNVPVGQNSLSIDISAIKPKHFKGALMFSEPQSQLVYSYYKDYGNSWIESILLEKELKTLKLATFNEATANVVRRKIQHILNLGINNDELVSYGIFEHNKNSTVVGTIVKLLEDEKTVIIDTSSLSGTAEILVGSIITNEIFDRYRFFKTKGELDNKPNVCVVLEEAPRVLGKEIVEKSSNVFDTLAREGRKFKVGLLAITQLPSLIPKTILANMNTKIILGLEMNPERQSIIESASHDLSKDSKTIAAQDKGEAIVSSTFLKFPVPVKFPFFHDFVTKVKSNYNYISSDEHEIKFNL